MMRRWQRAGKPPPRRPGLGAHFISPPHPKPKSDLGFLPSPRSPPHTTARAEAAETSGAGDSPPLPAPRVPRARAGEHGRRRWRRWSAAEAVGRRRRRGRGKGRRRRGGVGVGGRVGGWRSGSSAAKDQRLRLGAEELLESRLGFAPYTDSERRLGWLLTFSPVSPLSGIISSLNWE